MNRGKNNLNRREFLQSGAFAALSVGVVPAVKSKSQKKEEEIDTKKILNYHPEMRYRQLGKTDLFLSVISLGGIGFEKSLAHYAIDRGVNVVHIATGYNGGNAIRELGKVMKEKRDKVYIAVKANFKDMDYVLKTLHTDYIDFLMFNIHRESKVSEPKVLETFEKYKQQGKVRFAGLTSHDDVKRCIRAGIKRGLFSLIMPVVNQPNLEAVNEELKDAYDKDIGIMAMKTMKGIEELDLQTAFLKKILKNPAVTTIVKSIHSFGMFDAYLKAAQETLTSEEDFSLYRYAQKNRSNNCMMCGECRRVCPENIEISTLLRCKYYYTDQLNDLQAALSTYKETPQKRFDHAYCTLCRKCEEICPNGISIVSKLSETVRFFNSVVV